jgi:hypothetical protein
MSTRCNIHFTQGEKVRANIYRHSDGYPEGVLPDLDRFFEAVEKQTNGDTRFNDPEYLAAKYVVWQANEYAAYSMNAMVDTGKVRMLDFLSVGVTMQDASDGEYVYDVACEGSGRPKVSYTPAGGTNGS